jgi:catechol 2,3-dioxygenase-like lactoylglutathione lyase family enzyme
MSVVIDHLGLPAANAEAAAQWFADVLFVTEPSVSGHHVAFGVSEAEFAAIVDRLRQRGIDFGNDPEEPTNGATADPLGGKGRVYFRSPDDHFLEVTIQGAS